MAINGIQGELGNRVDGSLFADNLMIYITTRVGDQSTTRCYQQVKCINSRQRTNILHKQNNKHYIQKEKKQKPGTNDNIKPNHTLQGKYPVHEDDSRKQNEL